MENVQHGDLGIVSVRVVKREVPVRMIRYSLDANDGWWILADDDLPIPEIENVTTVCVHCVIKQLDPEVASVMDLALADARANEVGVGVAVRAKTGRWFTGEKALDVLETESRP